MDQSSPTSTATMKRRFSLLSQCWHNITGNNKDFETPAMPKLDNASSPRSSMYDTSTSTSTSTSTTTNSGSDKSFSYALSQLDDSLFEPIALITPPPKKRAKSESAAFAAAAAAAANASFDFHRTMSSSLQYPSFNYEYTGPSSYHGHLPTTAMFQQQQQQQQGSTMGSMYAAAAQSTNDFMSQLASMGAAAAAAQHHGGFAFSTTGNSYESPSATATPAAAVTPVTAKGTSSSLTLTTPPATTTDSNILLDEFEPLFDSEGDNERCPDLCASSSSLSTSSSSSPLPDEGGIVISTSDSFKENNYAKAEVEFMPSNSNVNYPASLSSSKTMSSIVGGSATSAFAPSPNSSSSSSSSRSKCKVSTSTNDNTSSSASLTSSTSDEKESPSRFKPFHEEKWNFHFSELLHFKKENGHCLVPHTFPSKPHLARWVKRQRRQYKLRLEGNKNSTMTEDRIKILNDIGFVWDSHEVIWNERFHQLVAYKQKVGHCRVPSYCKDCPQLASWVKCQRRQYKLFWEDGKGSSMNMDRIKLLNSIGFIWEVHPGRKKKENDPQHYQHLANILMDS